MPTRPRRISSLSSRSFLAALVLLPLLAATAQGQTLQWIRQFESDGSSQVTIGNGIAADSAGVYVVGYTTSTLPGQTSAGGTDAFIRKYDSSGNVVWTRQFGTLGFDQAFNVAVDGAGVYVSGRTNGAFSGQSNAGSTDAFLRKYDFNGNDLWTRQFGSSGDDEGIGVATGGGFVVISGEAGAALPNQTSLGMRDAFVREYDTSGNERWTRQFGTASDDAAHGVAADGAGVYSGGLTRGAFAGQSNAGGEDGFLQKHDHTGTAVWTRQFGTAADDEVEGVSASTGIYAGGDTFGTLAGQSTAGSADVFLMRVDFNGNIQWTRQFGSSGFDEGNGVVATPAGAAVAGAVGGTLAGQPSAGGTDAFVRFYDSAGAVSWTQQFGSPSFDEGHGVAWDGMSQFYSSGYVNGPLPGQTLNGAAGAFVARIGSGVACSYSISPASQAFGAPGGDGSVSVTTDPVCGWTAASQASFVTVTSGATVGSGTMTYSVTANPGTARMATLSVADKTFTVTQAGSPQGTLSVSPAGLNLSATEGPGGATRHLQIQSSSGSRNWSATLAVLNGAGWISISPASGTATSSQPSPLTVTINYSGLSARVYQATITVLDTASGAVITVPVTVSIARAEYLNVRPLSLVFRTVQGGSAPPTQEVSINTFALTMPWSFSEEDVATAPWLTITPMSGASKIGSCFFIFTCRATLSVQPAGLEPGVYQALVRINAPTAANTPQLISVTLHVVPPGTPAKAELATSGMVFVALQGGANPLAQTLSVSNIGGGTLTFSYTAVPESGNWLAVTPANGSVSSAAATAQVAVNAAGLSPGIYRGKITATFSSGPSQEIEVLLVVTPAASITAQRDLPGAAACAPASMDFVIKTIGNGVSLPVSFPRTLQAEVADNCGTAVTGATLVASLEGRGILLQDINGGLYSGDWTPEREAAAVPVAVSATHPSYPAVQRSFTVSTSAAAGGIVLPVLLPGGVVEGAGFTPLRPLAPGGIISIFGQRFASGDNVAASVPLPTTLAGVSVRIGGAEAPLYYAGPGQINAQVPVGVQAGDSVSIVVSANGRITTPQSYPIAPAQPGVFKWEEFAAVLDSQYRNISAQNPARIGDTLQIFSTGLGLTDPQASTGEYSPSFSNVLNTVAVTIGGVAVPVTYQGLAPGFVGLYQVNVVLTGVGPGNHAVVLQQNGIASNPNLPVSIPVQ